MTVVLIFNIYVFRLACFISVTIYILYTAQSRMTPLANNTVMSLRRTPSAQEAANILDLLLLPWELRNIVYRYAFSNTTLDIFENPETGEEHYNLSNSSRCLLGVSKQIRAEAAPYLYHDLSIHVEPTLLPTERSAGDPQRGPQGFLHRHFYYPEIVEAFSHAHAIAISGGFQSPLEITDILFYCTSLQQLDLPFESSSIANLFTRNGTRAKNDLRSTYVRKLMMSKELELITRTMDDRVESAILLTTEVKPTGSTIDSAKYLEGGEMVRIDRVKVCFRLKLRAGSAMMRDVNCESAMKDDVRP